MIFSKQFASEVYDILIKYCDASVTEKESFIDSHSNDREYGECTEWRFCGNLGFGGKYRSNRNTVDCYSEDINPKRGTIIVTTNNALQSLAMKYLKCKYLKFNQYSLLYTHNFSNSECTKSMFGNCRHISDMINGKKFNCKNC